MAARSIRKLYASLLLLDQLGWGHRGDCSFLHGYWVQSIGVDFVSRPLWEVQPGSRHGLRDQVRDTVFGDPEVFVLAENIELVEHLHASRVLIFFTNERQST